MEYEVTAAAVVDDSQSLPFIVGSFIPELHKGYLL